MATRLVLAGLAAIAALACDDPTRSLAPDSAPLASKAGTNSGYTVTDLGTLGGTYSYADDLNDEGVVVGSSETSSGAVRAFAWTPGPDGGPGRMQDLGTLPGWASSYAHGINNQGDIVGSVSNADVTQSRPVRWNKLASGSGYAIEALEHLGGHKGAADAINNKGEASGASCPEGLKSHVMVWSRKGNLKLGTNGGIATIAFDINDNGQLAVTRDIGDMFSYAYLWSEKDGFRDIGHLGGTGPIDGTLAWALNNRAEVTGISTTVDGLGHAFIWSEQGGMQDLGTLGGTYSEGADINDHGQIVGLSETADGSWRTFIWSRERGMRETGALVAGGFAWAAGINERGLIAGAGDTPDGQYHAVLWTPRTSE